VVAQRPSIAARDGAGDEVGGGGVVDAVAGLDGAVAEDRGEHRLADAGRPDQQRVGLVVDEAQRREVLDEAAVQGRLGVEVELLERPARGQLGEAQPASEAALLDGVDLGGEQVVQELGVAGLVALGLLERGGELLGDRWEAQVGQMLSELLVDGVGHQHAASASCA
jgi:hypothetical protein